jgi:hypothetical protein
VLKSELLFDVSPIEDEDVKKRKPSKRKKNDEPPPKAAPIDYGYVPGYIASLDVPCERCGMSITDLAEVFKNEWLVVCGWGCNRHWYIDPIPGVLEAVKPSHILRSGRFKGKTFDEVWESGETGKMYVDGIANAGQNAIDSLAAREWLAKKNS